MYKNFKEMPIWQKSMEIAETIHRLTDKLPQKEDYGSQHSLTLKSSIKVK